MKTRHHKAGLIAIVLVIIAALIAIGLFLFQDKPEQQTPEEAVREQMLQQAEEHTHPVASESTDTNTYVSPIDFDALYDQNPDICAWLDIPGTQISYPILKNDTDDAFYLDHDSLLEESVSGSLFLDDYNDRSFDDPVSVIYGHHMKSGAFFGELQSFYQDIDSFMEHQEMTLYLPDSERTYEVFAAVPYQRIHILYNYDFTDMFQHYIFFDRIYEVRALTANTIEELYPNFGEKVLILSTCYAGDNTQRYLVLAKEKP